MALAVTAGLLENGFRVGDEMNAAEQAYLGHYPESELVLGVVCPLGTNYRPVLDTLSNLLGQFGYENSPIQLSD